MNKQPNILMLIGVAHDPVLSYFARFLLKRNASVVFIDQARLGKDLHFDHNGWHLPGAISFPHDSCGGVFCRLASFAHDVQYDSAVVQANSLLLSILDSSYALVVNRPSTMMSNTSKPYQSYRVLDIPLKQPDYRCLANVVLSEQPRDAIVKSISATRSIVQPLHAVAAGKHIAEPILVQRCIHGLNVRVHIVGDVCHAVAIRSSDIDYRYSKDAHFRPYCLPKDVRYSCLEICARFGLIFAGIDLIYANGSFYFLEVNPAPGYDYFEKAVGTEVTSAALYAVLTRQVARC